MESGNAQQLGVWGDVGTAWLSPQPWPCGGLGVRPGKLQEGWQEQGASPAQEQPIRGLGVSWAGLSNPKLKEEEHWDPLGADGCRGGGDRMGSDFVRSLQELGPAGMKG